MSYVFGRSGNGVLEVNGSGSNTAVNVSSPPEVVRGVARTHRRSAIPHGLDPQDFLDTMKSIIEDRITALRDAGVITPEKWEELTTHFYDIYFAEEVSAEEKLANMEHFEVSSLPSEYGATTHGSSVMKQLRRRESGQRHTLTSKSSKELAENMLRAPPDDEEAGGGGGRVIDYGEGEGHASLRRIEMARGGGGAPSMKHGGIVKGKKGQAVPIVAHAGELVVPVKAVDKVLKSSAWINHVKSVQKAQGVSYKEAMKMAKGSYKK